MKLKALVEVLERVESFARPQYELEQYGTPATLAASILWAVDERYGDVAGLHVLDLGCGTGMLGIAAATLGAAHVTGVDIDNDALAQAAANASAADAALSLVRADVLRGRGLPLRGVFDVAVINPPFGTRRAGADVAFLRAALDAVRPDGRVYSLHKSSTRPHLLRIAAGLGVGAELVAELRFEIPAMYDFHRAETADVAVDLLRFVKGRGAAELIARHDMIPVPVGRAAAPAVARGRGGRGGGVPHGAPHRGSRRER